ncbi:MAG: endolytic transglycosylase MltG, partial [Cetobacterium sp.]
MKKKILILLFLILTIPVALFKFYSIKIEEKRDYKVQINLKQGTSLSIVFNKLGIDKSMIFKIFLKYEKNSGKNIKAGFYEFDGKYSYKDILQMMEEGKVKYTILTIPEGYSIKEIGKLLQDRG